jgi:hypothetical protein
MPRKTQKLVERPHVLSTIRSRLIAAGFLYVGHNLYRTSRYFARPGRPWRVRVSNHHMTDRNQQRSDQIVLSVVVSAMTHNQIEAAARRIVEDYDAACAAKMESVT